MREDEGKAEQMQGVTLDLENYVPYFVRAIANKLAQAATKDYKNHFDVGLNEWACLALLAREPDISAVRISDVGGYDKAVISRSLAALQAKGLIVSEATTEHHRKRLLRLTALGREIHDQIAAMAMQREQRLLQGLTPDDQSTLRRLLRQLHRSAQNLD